MAKLNYRELIQLPIEDDMPQGVLLSDQIEFEFVESQMIMIGSLSHTNIEWEKVEEDCIYLLSEKSKDIRVLGYLLQVLQYLPTIERYQISIAILADFIEYYWDIAYPFKGARGETAKERSLVQMVNRSITALEQLEINNINKDNLETLKDEWKRLILIIGEKYEDHSLIADLYNVSEELSLLLNEDRKRESVLENKSSDEQSVNKGNDQNDYDQKKGSELDDSTQKLSLPEANIRFDRNNEYGFKRTLKEIAHFYKEIRDWDMFVRSRRVGLWFLIDSAPPDKSEGVTELTAVPIEIQEPFQEKIKLEECDHETWLALEEIVFNNPFWFKGHLLSYLIAQLLNYDLAAKAIKECLINFANKIPKITSLKFRDNTPFMPEEVEEWLGMGMLLNKDEKNQVNDSKKDDSTIVDVELSSNREQEIEKLYHEIGFEAVLETLNKSLAKAVNLRDEIYWRLSIANIFNLHKMPEIALETYQYAQYIIEDSSIFDWEPELIKMLDQKVILLKKQQTKISREDI